VEKEKNRSLSEMKAVTVYPSVVMRIICPNCGAEGQAKRKRPGASWKVVRLSD